LLFKSTGARIRPLAFTNNAQVTPVTWGQWPLRGRIVWTGLGVKLV
jgi:hypothetical protein